MKTTSYTLFKVISPGLFTTVQDKGRFGYQKYGVPVNGVMDSFSAAIANILVGNGDDSAVLECTVIGPTLLCLDIAYVVVTGASMPIHLNGEEMESWRSFRVKVGDVLELGQVQSGCRSYLAVTGGIEVPLIMGSRSCYVGAGLGGLHGRALQKGDSIPRGVGKMLDKPRRIPRELVPIYSEEIILRAIPGPQDDYFDEDLDKFFNSEFHVSHEANRAGYRLNGPTIRQKPSKPVSIISESNVPGGVQIPPNGQPIILLTEQTVGGYTKIATIISSDLDLIGQAIPGNIIRFQRTDLETAYALKKGQKRIVDNLKIIIDLIDDVRDLQHQCAADNENISIRRFAELYPECVVRI
ncbi:5-oxoprolinase subunit C family protein [Desulfocastanea catecholica]